ncbi:hypothetical protein pipiens_018577 [Culex pipiens pipiens]|uniref:Uncharacterized protein n=1 Tax=Culex pipiens pipiens TaxID=38569 RepID=A0ABD1CB41_CULPP
MKHLPLLGEEAQVVVGGNHLQLKKNCLHRTTVKKALKTPLPATTQLMRTGRSKKRVKDARKQSVTLNNVKKFGCNDIE